MVGLMSTATIEHATGSLVLDGAKVFPLILSDGPPRGGTTPPPHSSDAWTEIAQSGRGANFLRTGRTVASPWTLADIDAQIANERATMDAAHEHGLYCWPRLVNAANLPSTSPSEVEQILVKLTAAFKDHPALGAYKGADEPFHGNTPPDGLIRAYERLKQLDPNHPLVIIQAPMDPQAELVPYRPAFDITGADIYPVSYGVRDDTESPNTDISVVGEVTKKMVAAAGAKPVWMTLQIAWTGTIPSPKRPDTVPRFPTLHQERFMAYQAVIHGARGLAFFGGEYTQVMRPRDAAAGWNWTFWDLVLKPLFEELTHGAVQPLLTAPTYPHPVTTTVSGIELTTRHADKYLYLLAVRTTPAPASKIQFTGLPARNDGSPLTSGEVLVEYVQQTFRKVDVNNGSFTDWFGPHDARAYRFALS
jgi:hypothetical protein